MAKKYVEREVTLADLVSEALGDITSLAEEMREAFDNTPESLQQSGVGEARGQAADDLENISEPDVPEELGTEKIKVFDRQRTMRQMAKQSRSSRRDDAVGKLQRVVEHLDEAIEDTANMSKDEIEQAETLRDEIQAVLDEAEAVEFPGMFG